jgi:hypothetical protein
LPKKRKGSNSKGNQAVKRRSKKPLAERIKLIRSGRGILKRMSGGNLQPQSIMEERRAEREKEDRN